MLIKSVTKHIKDVFLSAEGWSNWVRIDLRANRIINSDNRINKTLELAILSQVRTTLK